MLMQVDDDDNSASKESEPNAIKNNGVENPPPSQDKIRVAIYWLKINKANGLSEHFDTVRSL